MTPNRVEDALRMMHTSVVDKSVKSDLDDDCGDEIAPECVEASIVLDEDAWEEALDESGIDYDMLCDSQRRSSMPWSVD